MEHLRHKSVWLPDPARIGSRSLQPLTLGHLRMLELINSPWIFGGNATRLSAGLTISVLCSPWRKTLRRLRHPSLLRAIAYLYAPKPEDVVVVSSQILHFVEDTFWTPDEYIQDTEADDRTRRNSIPQATSLAVRIALKASRLNLDALQFDGKPKRSVWDWPLEQLLQLFVASAEADGREYETRTKEQPWQAMM